MPASPQHIIISRTDSIGDVVLTLPVAAMLKQLVPGCRITFIGRNYTRAVIEACRYVDAFIDRDEWLSAESPPDADVLLHVFPDASIARMAARRRIPMRVGTTNRIYHWFTCNRLIRLSRRNSSLHEAQLNLRLLKPFGYQADLPLNEIAELFGVHTGLAPLALQQLLQHDKYNLLLHPKSQGSAREWGIDNFVQLVRGLDKNRFSVFITGTAAERKLLDPLFQDIGNEVTDITGQMTLAELMAFINAADGLLANSTGPLHLAAALGKDAMGLFAPMQPIHPGRWAPLGMHAQVFVKPVNCEDCRNKPAACHCIHEIPVDKIRVALNAAAERKFVLHQ